MMVWLGCYGVYDLVSLGKEDNVKWFGDEKYVGQKCRFVMGTC